MRLLFLDVETTGLIPRNTRYNNLKAFENCRLWELGFITNTDCVSPVTYSAKVAGVVAPEGHPFPVVNSNEQPIMTILATLLTNITSDTILIGHNLDFDIAILKSEFLRLDLLVAVSILEKCPRLDTMKIYSEKFPQQKWPRLGDLFEKFFGRQPNISHSALADVETTVMCFYAMWIAGFFN